jgi:hypothetical protein
MTPMYQSPVDRRPLPRALGARLGIRQIHIPATRACQEAPVITDMVSVRELWQPTG